MNYLNQIVYIWDPCECVSVRTIVNVVVVSFTHWVSLCTTPPCIELHRQDTYVTSSP